MEREKLLEIYTDIENRSRIGTFIYAAAWLIIGLGTGFSKNSPTIFSSVLSLFLIIGILRVLFLKLYALKPYANYKVRVTSIYVYTLVPALVLSVLFSMSMINHTFIPLFLYLLMTMFALLSGGVSNFCPRPKLSTAYIAVLVLPPFLTSILLSADHYIEAAMLLAYGTYMLALSKRLTKEYEERIQQQAELRRLNNEDSLTGVSNRRAFDKQMAKEWSLHSRTKEHLSLLLIDIDFFKKVNDGYGHAAGDAVIKSTAHFISSICSRQNDSVARIGGEEFAVIMPLSEPLSVQALAEDIRNKVQSTPIVVDGKSISVTVSVGVASSVPNFESSVEKLFKAADSCLYEAKNSGRNKVVSASL